MQLNWLSMVGHHFLHCFAWNDTWNTYICVPVIFYYFRQTNRIRGLPSPCQHGLWILMLATSSYWLDFIWLCVNPNIQGSQGLFLVGTRGLASYLVCLGVCKVTKLEDQVPLSPKTIGCGGEVWLWSRTSFFIDW